MAITNNFGSQVSNVYGSTPALSNQTGTDGANPCVTLSTAAIVTTDSIGSTYRMVRVFSSDIPTSIKLSSTALTAGAVSLGLYTPQTGAVVNVNLFATAVSCAAAVTQQDQRFVNKAITTLGQRLWQLLGLSADPLLYYDLVLTSTTAATANGTLAIQYDWTR